MSSESSMVHKANKCLQEIAEITWTTGEREQSAKASTLLMARRKGNLSMSVCSGLRTQETYAQSKLKSKKIQTSLQA